MTVEQRNEQGCPGFGRARDEAGALVERQIFHRLQVKSRDVCTQIVDLAVCWRFLLVTRHSSRVTLICFANQLSPNAPMVCCGNIEKSLEAPPPTPALSEFGRAQC